MHKTIQYLLVPLLLSACQNMNRKLDPSNRPIAIDSIRTTEDAWSFINPVVLRDTSRSSDWNWPPKNLKAADSLKVIRWFKADFDSNGHTDLLVAYEFNHWSYLACVMDSGGGKLSVHYLWYNVDSDFDSKVEKIAGRQAVIFKHKKWTTIQNQIIDSILPDTLVFKFGDFIEYNSFPAHHSIEKILYYSRRADFSIAIFQDGHVTLDSLNLYGQKWPLSKSVISASDYNDLAGLLNYADFSNWQYQNGEEPDYSYELAVYYDHSKDKSLHDFHYSGYALRRLHDLLIGLVEVNKKQKRK